MNRLYLLHQERIRLVVNSIIIIGLLITGRFFYIQVLYVNTYEQQITDKLKYKKKVKGERGKIYDRNGIVLAENITKVTFWANTKKNIDIPSISSFFSFPKVSGFSSSG